ncbi:hypothetical protein OH76DRAFT_879276 [Lentinus brumalis]|uniref:Uncharacterized protein n=1 Tax=Lentinus brumalis TaxID=2498619 RepID=A0A371DRS1_9APHY|nr:hypothetical protein OH76DRAFT_879276 [Polyporus brumalis]
MRRACSLSPTIRAGIPRLPLRGRSRRGVPDSPGNGSSRSAHCVNVYSIIFLASGLSDASFIDLNFSGSWTGARACPSGQDSRLQQQRSVQRPLGRSEVGGAIRDAWNQGSAPPTLPRSIQHAPPAGDGHGILRSLIRPAAPASSCGSCPPGRSEALEAGPGNKREQARGCGATIRQRPDHRRPSQHGRWKARAPTVECG